MFTSEGDTKLKAHIIDVLKITLDISTKMLKFTNL